MSPTGEVIRQSFRMGFKAFNNEAEYETMVTGLQLAKSLGARQLKVTNDSQIIINQINGEYISRDSKMAAYLALVNNLMS